MSDTSLQTDANAARDRLHLIIAAILAALLLVLPFISKIGPNAWRNCAAAPASAAAAPILPRPSVSTASPAEPAAVTADPAPVEPAPAPVEPAPTAPVAVVPEEPPPAARVYFGLDRITLPGNIETSLAEVVDYLKRHPEAKAELKGFHDRRGKADHNTWLANNRATNVSDYLIAAGIPADRVIIAQPQETTGSGPHREARRVEVAVIR